MLRRAVVLVGMVWALCSPAWAQQDDRWVFGYINGNAEGELQACSASVTTSYDFFTARLYQDRLDFLYSRDDFTLPFGQVLGQVIFRIGESAFVVTASTNDRPPDSVAQSARLVFFDPRPEDQGALFAAFRDGSRFFLEFPNGLTYEFGDYILDEHGG